MAPSLTMTREEREAFLVARHVGVISIEDPGRAPLAAPIWYDYTPEKGVWVLTGKTSKKGVALDKAGRFGAWARFSRCSRNYLTRRPLTIPVGPRGYAGS